MIARAGLLRRALAAVVDMAVAQVALQVLVVLLFRRDTRRGDHDLRPFHSLSFRD